MGELLSWRRRALSVGILGLAGLLSVPLSCSDTERTYGDGSGGSDAGGGGEDTGGTSTGGRGGTGTGGRGGSATGGSGNEGGAPEGGSGNTGGSEAGAGNEGGDSGASGAGEGGTGGATGGMAGTGGCTFVSAEDCFNGRDDDCNGSVDAADSACTSSTQCVPAAASFTMGILFDDSSADCPAAFANSDIALNRALSPGAGCTGCSCTASIQCSAQVYEYSTLAQCQGDTALTGGTLQGTVTSNMCLNNASLISGPGFRVGPYTTTNGNCVPSGTPTRSTPTWGSSTKFCGTNLVGGGCSQGQVAIPRTTERRCVVALGSQTCPAGYLAENNPWYTGFDDTRTCSACTCGTRTSGDCTRTASGSAISVALHYASSQTCGSGTHRSVGSNAKDCTVLVNDGPHNAMDFNSNMPLLPSCPGVSNVSGALTPTGQYTMCCAI